MNKIKTLILLLACLTLSLPSNATTTDTGYTAVAAGRWYSVALKADGTLWSWGNIYNGLFANGITQSILTPKQIGTGYTAISASMDHAVALKADGSLWAWGSNDHGQLGDGTTTPSLAPKQIGTGYSAISAGYSHTVALKTDGSLWTWGSNDYGQLGDGTTKRSLVPKQIGTASYTSISAGNNHTIALKADGSLWAWGNNDYGQLGDGTTTPSLVPKQVGSNYSAISASVSYNMALKSDGSLWVWGSNTDGRLGDGNISNDLMPQLTNVLTPKQIGTGYAAIAAGESHSLALKSDGSLWAWGANYYGELGYGTTVWTPVPKQIGTDAYSAIASGGYHTVALKPDGSLWAWGSNYYGQLGDGTTTDSLVPKQIIDTGYAETPDTTAPSVPTGPIVISQATSAYPDYVDLFWTPSTDNVGVFIYRMYREGVWIGDTSTNHAAVNSLATDRFTVSACDAAGNCSALSAAASVTSSTQAPSAPTGLTATAVSATQVDLAWMPSAGNVGGITYEVYRTLAGSCENPYSICDTGPAYATKLLTTLSGSPSPTSYSDTTLPSSISNGLYKSSYNYFVRACDAAGNCSALSTAASVTLSTLAPSVPGGLTATAVGATQVDLAWTPSVGNIGIATYEIYRMSPQTCARRPSPFVKCSYPIIPDRKLLTTLSGNPPQTSYSDTGTAPSTFYSYLVRACDATGNCSALTDRVLTETQSLPVRLKKPPIATTTSYGPITNQTIRIAMAPPEGVPNLTVGSSIFVAAVLPSSRGGGTYFWNFYANTWLPYTSCATAPVSYGWGFDATQYLDVVPTPTDLSSLKGTKIYVGYGIGTTATGGTAESCIDMLNNSTYTQAYTIN